MIKHAYSQGAQEALRRYGVKEAASWMPNLRDIGRSLKVMAIGNPSELLKGRALFRPGGMLHWENVFWPRTPGIQHRPIDKAVKGFKLHEPAGGFAAGTHIDDDVFNKLKEQGVTHAATAPTWRHHLGVNAARLFQTGLPAYYMAQSAFGEGDPNEGRLSNILGSAGSLIGSAYGGTALGTLGQMVAAPLGDVVGKRVGRLLGSRPSAPEPPPPTYPTYPAYPPYPPNYPPNYPQYPPTPYGRR